MLEHTPVKFQIRSEFLAAFSHFVQLLCTGTTKVSNLCDVL